MGADRAPALEATGGDCRKASSPEDRESSALANRLLTPLARRGEFDVIRDFAVPFPVTIIAEMLGIPACDFATSKRWSDHLVGFLDPLASPGPKVLRKTIDEFDAYMSRLAEERRQEPAEDLLTALVQADEQGQRCLLYTSPSPRDS